MEHSWCLSGRNFIKGNLAGRSGEEEWTLSLLRHAKWHGWMSFFDISSTLEWVEHDEDAVLCRVPWKALALLMSLLSSRGLLFHLIFQGTQNSVFSQVLWPPMLNVKIIFQWILGDFPFSLNLHKASSGPTYSAPIVCVLFMCVLCCIKNLYWK